MLGVCQAPCIGNPTGEKPAGVIVILVLQTRPGRGGEVESFPWLAWVEGLLLGAGPRRGGWVLLARAAKALARKGKRCPENYKLGLWAGWLYG